MNQIEAYIKFKPEIDTFYDEQWQQILHVDIDDIIAKYSKSNINLNSLQSAHKNCEISK